MKNQISGQESQDRKKLDLEKIMKAIQNTCTILSLPEEGRKF